MQLNTGYHNSYYQVNYYYDSDIYELDKLDITCRIREHNGSYKAAIKAHQNKESECSIEHSTMVLNELDSTLFDQMNIKIQGYTITFRSTLLFCDKLKVRFDRNYYLNTEDYEMEIEYDLAFAQQANKLLGFFAEALHKLDETISPKEFCARANNYSSKSHRFFDRKKSLIN